MTSPTRRLIAALFWPIARVTCQAIGLASRAAWLWTGAPLGRRESDDRLTSNE